MGPAFTVALLVAAIGATSSPVSAECVRQTNEWPAFSDVAKSAKRIVVGEVVEGIDQFDTGQHVSYRLKVHEVLRGSAPEFVEVRALKSRMPLRGSQSCRAASYLSARVGDLLAIAYRGKAPGVTGRVNTAAWIEGRPHPKFTPGAQRLGIATVRSVSGHATDGSTLPPDRGILPSMTIQADTLAGSMESFVSQVTKGLAGLRIWLSTLSE